jgi:hypothetical protein
MSSLLDKYLPHYHFSETHRILIAAKPEAIWPFVQNLDTSSSRIVRMLYRLRGLPKSMLDKKGFEKEKFAELEVIPNDELIIGLIGQFWKVKGNLQRFSPSDFVRQSEPGFAKAVMNFKLVRESENQTWVTTDTRVQVNDRKARFRFSCYWFIIRPFSGLIRMEMLKAIKNKCIL